jgi:hypothetical protein
MARKSIEPEPVQLEMFAVQPPSAPATQSARAAEIAERIASQQREKRELERAVRSRTGRARNDR